MELKNQVVSLELAKKLKELGVKQSGIFSWMLMDGEWSVEFHTNNTNFSLLKYEDWVEACATSYPAFTVAELAEFLVDHKHNFLPYFCDNPRERCWVYNFGQYPEYVEAKTLADCLAKMLIYLIENNLITL